MSRVAAKQAGTARRDAERAAVLGAAPTLQTPARAWDLLAAGAQFLREGDDGEVRRVCERAATVLGLGALPDRTLERRARQNLALVEGVDAEAAVSAWRARRAVYLRARDGNVVRARDPEDVSTWDWIGDLRGQAAAFCAQHLSHGSRDPIGPVTVEGASPPWLLLSLHDALPRLRDGYWPMLHVVQRDPAALAEGFALADLSGVLSRARIFSGEDAGERLSAFVRSRMDYPATGPVIPQAVELPVAPPIGELVRALGDEQKAAALELHRDLIRRDRGRDQAYWAERWREDRPKRVLIPTCRYSTFIQHSSRDLADAFESAGWEARVLIEPDDHARFSSIAYHRAQLDFDPDLIVLINYPRATRPDAFPTQTPFVCWIQDAMPHLFDERVGREHGPRDMVIGHLYPKLFREFGYPSARTLSMPVVASAKKFHARPVDAGRAARFACDIAYVSHHSETPTAMHQRLCDEVGDPTIIAVLDEMRRLLGERYQRILSGNEPTLAKRIPADAWARVHGAAATPRVLSQLREQYVVPILERVIRHEMLAWASEVADRRGWSLRIYGNGWESHGTLGRFAAGPLEHGEDLRAAYAGATVHLHASMSTLVHQRVMECALSGGLALCRLTGPNLSASRQKALFELVLQGVEPDEVGADGMLGFRTADHEPLRRYAALLETVGKKVEVLTRVHPGVWTHMRQYPCAFRGPAAEELLGDLSAACFQSGPQLESIVHRLRADPDARRRASEAAATRVREAFTLESAVPRLDALIKGVIDPGLTP